MELKLAALALILVSFCGIFADASPHKEVKKWAEKIGKHHFMTGCWGEKTMMKMHKMAMKFCDECMQLTPAFDIDIFSDDDGDEMGLNEISLSAPGGNPFLQSNQGFQTLPSQVLPQRVQAGAQFQNPWQAWAQMWAPLLQQQVAAPTYQYRGKRAIDPPTQEDLEEFAEHVDMFKQMKKSNIGNLTCVLSKFGALDSNLNVRLTHFTNEMWTKFPRGEEPPKEFKDEMIKGLQNCYQMSQGIPQEVLDRKGSFYKQFGRQMMFFKCKKMVATEKCVKKELAQWVEYMWGTPDQDLRAQLGLPKGTGDMALMAFAVKEKMMAPSQKFVHEFLFDM